MQTTQRLHRAPRGFSFLEILVALGIVALLAQVAITAYGRYVARARAADLELVFDQMKTRTGVATRGSGVTDSCASLVQQIQTTLVSSEYAALDIAFEAVPNGYTPMLRFCATHDVQGSRGVDVSREAHHLLSRVTTMGKGAVVGESAVSFAVPSGRRQCGVQSGPCCHSRISLCDGRRPDAQPGRSQPGDRRFRVNNGHCSTACAVAGFSRRSSPVNLHAQPDPGHTIRAAGRHDVWLRANGLRHEQWRPQHRWRPAGLHLRDCRGRRATGGQPGYPWRHDLQLCQPPQQQRIPDLGSGQRQDYFCRPARRGHGTEHQ
jgi:prepilin-type N-terminal cleavage/methylation domain-containing protein